MRTLLAVVVVVAACSGDKPDTKPATKPEATSAPQPVPAAAASAMPAYAAKPMPAIVGDPCPLDHALDVVDEWPGCSGLGPFVNDESILGATAFPCDESTFDQGGAHLLFTTTFVRDATGRLLGSQMTNEHGLISELTYRYDGAGRHVSSEYKGRSSARWTYDRDARNRLVKTTLISTDPEGSLVTTYRRDDAGRLIVIDERDQRTPGAGLLADFDADPAEHETLTWRDGQLVASTRDTTDHNGRTSRTTLAVKRDAQGRRIEIIRTTGTEVRSVGFHYDGNGRLAELRQRVTVDGKPDPSQAQTTTIRYDADGHVVEIEDGGQLRRFRYACASPRSSNPARPTQF